MKPIVTFYHNMKRDGIDITHDGQKLNVKINNPALKDSPFIKAEIKKRANLLAQLLDLSGVPEELHEYIMVPLDWETAELMIDINKYMGVLLGVHAIGNDYYLEYVK